MFSEEFLVLLSADETCFIFFFSTPMLSPLNVAQPYLNAGIVNVLAKDCGIRVAHILKLASGGLLT